jgi:anti-sigma regulatory factor (Ser/Thr protein kinase)/serine/threonine protein phosphatase PrpC
MDDDIETVQTAHYTVAEAGDEVLVRTAVTDVADEVGFDETASEELGVVATELATNVRKHADSGEIDVLTITDGDRTGVRIESLDAGPGIEDVDAAFADGESTAGSLGGGLGAVNRFMDQVVVTAPGEPNYGTHVVADRWLRPEYAETTPCPLAFGAASRPKVPGTANGDSFILKRWNDSALVGVIDGLGHGQAAHEASMAAKEYVDRHFDNSLESIFAGAERACRGTRGVVMALARFDWAAETVTFASVGNINYKATGTDDLQLVVRRGVVGSNGPEPAVTSADWHPGNRLVMFSDGLVSHWNTDDYASLLDDPATSAARGLLREFGKDNDDATVLVVSERQSDDTTQ